jgi:hypothetical protein
VTGGSESVRALVESIPDEDALSPQFAARHEKRRNASERWTLRIGPTHSLLSPEQLQAAHLLHERARLSIPELARRGYRQWGYSNVHSATVALYRLFRRYDYPPRSRAEANRLLALNEAMRCGGETIYGKPCKRSALIGSSYCSYHGAAEADSQSSL